MVHHRKTEFYETDAMGIIHHANYILYFEEARVAWLRAQPFYEGAGWFDKINFPVLTCDVQYKKPIYFDDEIQVEVKVSRSRATLVFDYSIMTNRFPHGAASGKTTHAVMDMKTRRPIRIPQGILDVIEF